MTTQFVSAARGLLSKRRLVLLTSVAVLGAAVVAGPGGYRAADGLTASAQAVEAVRMQTGFADLIEKVKPAVIAVRVKIDEGAKTSGLGSGEQSSPLDRDGQLKKFFRQFGMPDMPNGMQRRRPFITGEGSGFFISADGYAVTNYHVVDHAKTVQVTLDDNRTLDAKVIGKDAKTDIALLKIKDAGTYPYVQFGKAAPRVGDWVVAIGNPFGLGGTVTAGIVSARGRDIGAGPYDDFIQIDAPVNKGNSGGPTFDVDGRVVGVNTAIFSPSGGSVGIAFAIPASTVKSVIVQLRDKGSVERGWIGVQIQTVTRDLADSLGMRQPEGALVADPQADGPAAKAGIESGDVIVSVNGNPVRDARDLAKKIGTMAPGNSVKLVVLRKGSEKTFTLTLGELPKAREARTVPNRSTPGAEVPKLGLSLAPASETASAGNAGAIVTKVDPDGTAAELGLKTGDVILDVGGKAVATPADVTKAIDDARASGKRTVLLRVKSGDATRFVALPLNRA